jgi:cholinesterase
VGDKKKAVLLWIYGGAFNIGDSSMRGTNGAAIANNQDIIVVSINYRVNIFGFPGAPTLPNFNPGFLDQRLAVEWTKNNIAAFGGDPERITLYGQSAGSMSVDDYAFSWTEDPIVNGFILSSGTALMSRGEVRTNQARNWYTLSQKLGCGGQEAGAATVKCLQGKAWKDIYDKIPAGPVGGFGPSNDNKTLFADVYDRARKGRFIKKASPRGTLYRER